MRESGAKVMNREHYTKLEHMYLTAPINAFYSPRIWISDGETVITIPVKREFFHAADAVHGSVYFKLLDDAAFFSVNSLIEDHFALTASFTTYLLRPISEGTMKATGKEPSPRTWVRSMKRMRAMKADTMNTSPWAKFTMPMMPNTMV